MPHITIEYSANVGEHHDIDALVGTVHEAALAHGLPDVTGLRTRAAERMHYRAMAGEPSYAFVAIHCRVGPGRSQDEKRSFIEQVLDAAESALEGTPLEIAWSIELTELDTELRINRNHVRSAMAADDRDSSAMAADDRDSSAMAADDRDSSAMAAGEEAES